MPLDRRADFFADDEVEVEEEEDAWSGEDSQ